MFKKIKYDPKIERMEKAIIELAGIVECGEWQDAAMKINDIINPKHENKDTAK